MWIIGFGLATAEPDQDQDAKNSTQDNTFSFHVNFALRLMVNESKIIIVEIATRFRGIPGDAPYQDGACIQLEKINLSIGPGFGQLNLRNWSALSTVDITEAGLVFG